MNRKLSGKSTFGVWLNLKNIVRVVLFASGLFVLALGVSSMIEANLGAAT